MKDFELNFGSQVHCRDKQCGRLAKIVVNPDTWQVTDLIVEDGFLMKSARVLPVSLIEREMTTGIYLAANSTDVARYPEYRETEVEEPVAGTTPAGTSGPSPSPMMEGTPHGLAISTPAAPVMRRTIHEGIRPDTVIVGRGTPIRNSEGVIGKLDRLFVTAEYNYVSGLVMRQGVLLAKQRVVPAWMIEDVNDEGFSIIAPPESLQQLALYRPRDEEARAEIKDEEVNIMDQNEETVLSEESMLSAQIAESLSASPQTEDAVIEVIADRGVVTLTGRVEDQETREAAEAIVAEHPDVISVVNELEIESQ